ncbi:pyridoxamine 5'-phosphate oxidase [Propionibacteriaceae bacterium Y2011]|uniref:pyridoxamine 5'-phosphate oxidase n=1 Tax=Microlunatus sp. Y2014 TaxID=3418488 RepID=UPI003B4466B8
MDSTELGRRVDRLAREHVEYRRARLLEADLPVDPLPLFDQWLADAFAIRDGMLDLAADLLWLEPTAMTVSTIADGRPRSRNVLLKHRDERGFVFFTNYQSDKGRELAARPEVALHLAWTPLQRQVRIEGVAGRVDRDESVAYFATRPRGSQLGAWASAQSRPVTEQELATSYATVEARFEGREVPCPDHWGGFVVEPHTIEFWQGRPDRMHDRIRFRRRGVGWHHERLAP